VKLLYSKAREQKRKTILLVVLILTILSLLRIRIRDPVPFSPWIRDPGWIKSKDSDPGPGSGMEKFGYGIRDGKKSDPGSGDPQH
jgi:hypothetical protein